MFRDSRAKIDHLVTHMLKTTGIIAWVFIIQIYEEKNSLIIWGQIASCATFIAMFCIRDISRVLKQCFWKGVIRDVHLNSQSGLHLTVIIMNYENIGGEQNIFLAFSALNEIWLDPGPTQISLASNLLGNIICRKSLKRWAQSEDLQVAEIVPFACGMLVSRQLLT